MKRLLLDTHVLLWWLTDDPKLGPRTKNMLIRPNNTVFISAVSIWEMSIKSTLGKLQIPSDIVTVIDDEGFEQLPISLFHAHQAGQLKPIHKDPFDRMLIAQTQAEGLMLVTADTFITQYGIQTLNPHH